MNQAIEVACNNVRSGLGGPFGAVIVKDGSVISVGVNEVTKSNDPTAHAEIVAIREACRVLDSFQLTGCVVYSSCQPCPMCLAALYWARPESAYYANTHEGAAAAGFDDSLIYQELSKPPESQKLTLVRLMTPHEERPFELWMNSQLKKPY